MKTLTHTLRFALAAALLVCSLPLSSLAATPTATSFSTAVPANRQSLIQLQGADADGTALTFATLSSPSHGALSNLNGATGVVVYTPTAGYTGADSFTYKVTSGGEDSTTATVTITVSNAKTTVTDTITDPSGSARQGKITFILTQAVTTPAGLVPAGTSVSASLNSSGGFSAQLYPSRGMSPQAYYQVWFADATSLNRELLGVYDIPLSTSPVGLAAYKVTDTNLAARYTFASVAGLEALTKAVTNAAVALLMAESRTAGKLQYWNGSTLADSLVSQSGPTITLGGPVVITGNLNANKILSAEGYVGILSSDVPSLPASKIASGTLDDARLPSTLNNKTIAGGSITGVTSVTATGTVQGAKLKGDCSECTGITGATGGVSNTGSTTIGADTDANGTGSVALQTGGVTRVDLSAAGRLTGTAIDDLTERPTALRFDGGSNMQHVDYGPFFDARRTDLGPMMWEVWAKPGTNALSRYMISDGYSGLHAVLFGFTSGTVAGRNYLYFNATGGSFIEVVSDDGPAADEWGHYRVAYDGGQVVVSFNGVPVGRKAWAGPRTTHAPGGGRLFIGGSDHNNFHGLVAQARGFEGVNAADDTGNFNPLLNSFTPATVFQKTLQGPLGALYRASFLTSFMRPRERPLDESDFQNHGRRHALPFTGGFLNGAGGRTGAPLPAYVFDAGAPAVSGATAPAGTPNAAATCPAGALICDTFSRANSLRIFNGLGGWGQTEGGTRGALTWSINNDAADASTKPLGILNGVGVVLSNSAALALVDAAQTDVSVQVDRLAQPTAGESGKHTAIAFRGSADETDWCYGIITDSSVDTNSSSSVPALRLGCSIDNVETTIVNNQALPNQTWKTFKIVVKSDGSIRAYVGTNGIFTEIGSGWTSALLASNTKVGVYVRTTSTGLSNRWDNFIVEPAP